MVLDAATAHELIQRLNADREAYIESSNRTHQLLLQAIAASAGAHRSTSEDAADEAARTSLSTTIPNNHLTTDLLLRRAAPASDIGSLRRDLRSSILTGASDDSGFDDSESLFASTPLIPSTYTEDDFRHYLEHYDWTWADKQILQDVLDPIQQQNYLQRKCIFPTDLDDQPDRSHLSHYSIFDVGSDGAPLPILDPLAQGPVSRSIAIWNRLKSLNDDPARQRKAVGRITIVREPSPLLFAALHYTHNEQFNMDEIFGLLLDDDPALSRPPNPFSDDERMQRSFVFSFEYFTIIDPGCEPMEWQRSDPRRGIARTHIPISRCSSAIALSFEGPPTAQVKNKQRRATKKVGNVFDPFSPWRVLSITAFPDEQSSLDAHDTTNHYVNGPEAFLVTLRSEFRDAYKRLTAVYKAITDMVEPPPDFVFNLDTRDKLLFEDDKFTYSRRYFWAFQTLGIMNEDIHDMILAYQETFTEAVWKGTDKIIWPGYAEDMASHKHANWRKRMKNLRKDIEREIDRLKDIQNMNTERMRIVKGLHGNLFNGTSVLESRKSVQTAMITVQQGRNIKLLTLVTIFFLPLTFVTSVFGMTNMPQNGPMDHFAWTTISICIPTYILIGSLNTSSGMDWWTSKTNLFFSTLGHGLALLLDLFNYRPSWTQSYHERSKDSDNDNDPDPIAWHARSKRVRAQAHELVPRGTFSGMPVLSPQNTAAASNGDINGTTFTSEKEPKQARPHRNSNPPLHVTSPFPPHRPSIGIVPPPGQSLPPDYAKSARSAVSADDRQGPTEDNDHLKVEHDRSPASVSKLTPPPSPSQKPVKDKKSFVAATSGATPEHDRSDAESSKSKSSIDSLPSSRHRNMFKKVFRSGSNDTGGSTARPRMRRSTDEGPSGL